MSFEIDSVKLGPQMPPWIVAEMSGNHGHSLDKALQLVNMAHAAGAHAVKIQTYTADTMTLDIQKPPFIIESKESLWSGKTFYSLYQEAYTPWEWHKPIFERCKQLGMLGFSTPFDPTSVDFLESLNVPCYKIASLEIVNHPLLVKVAATRKPLIISTGAATLAEIDEALQLVRKHGATQILLLKCTSSYPAEASQTNLKTLPVLASCFQLPVGLSDHSLGIGVAIAAISHGACMIEKHVTLSRQEGIDAAFSMEPHELKLLVNESLVAWQAQGKVHFGPLPSELLELSHRRSLYFAKALQKGDIITPEAIKAIRPGGGLHPQYLQLLLGKKVQRAVVLGKPVEWEDVL